MRTSDALFTAIDEARATDPLRPVTIVCMPGARDDLICELAQHSTMVGVQVVPLSAYPAQRATRPQITRMFVAHHVAQILAEESPARADASSAHSIIEADADHGHHNAFHAAGVGDSVATWRSLSELVLEVLSLPASTAPLTEGRALPQEVFRIAQLVAERAHAVGLITPAQAWEEALQPSHPQELRIGVDLLGQSPAERDFIERAIAQHGLKAITTFDTMSPQDVLALTPPHLEVVSCAEERDEAAFAIRAVRRALVEGTPPHRIALAYADPALLPLLRQEAIDTPLAGPVGGTNISQPRIAAFLRLAELALSPERCDFGALADALGTETITFTAQGTSRGARDNTPAGRPQQTAVEYLAPTSPHRIPPAVHTHRSLRQACLWADTVMADARAIAAATTFADISVAFNDLAAHHLRPVTPGEDSAWRALQHALGELGALPGDLGPRGVEGALEVLRSALASPQEPTTVGPSVGPLSHAVGRQLDLLILVGTSSTSLPTSVAEKSAITFAQENSSTHAAVDQQHQLLCRLMSGADKIIATTSRSSITGRSSRPSRWLPTPEKPSTGWVNKGAAYRLRSNDVVTPNSQEELSALYASHEVALARDGHPPRDLKAGNPETSLPGAHQDWTHLHRAARMHSARAQGDLTGTGRHFNGITRPFRSTLSEDKELSASQLENYANNPYVFFLTRECHAPIGGAPFDPDQVNPLDRGTWLHRILENFTRKFFGLRDDLSAPLAFEPTTRTVTIVPAHLCGADKQPADPSAGRFLNAHEVQALLKNTNKLAGWAINNPLTQETKDTPGPIDPQLSGDNAEVAAPVTDTADDMQRVAERLLRATLRELFDDIDSLTEALHPHARAELFHTLGTLSRAWLHLELTRISEGWVPVAVELGFGSNALDTDTTAHDNQADDYDPPAHDLDAQEFSRRGNATSGNATSGNATSGYEHASITRPSRVVLPDGLACTDEVAFRSEEAIPGTGRADDGAPVIDVNRAGEDPHRTFRIRGSIDRVEFNTTTGVIRLVDYKSGRVPADDDVVRLQLPFYGEAFRLTPTLEDTNPTLLATWYLAQHRGQPDNTSTPGTTTTEKQPVLSGMYLYLGSLTDLDRDDDCPPWVVEPLDAPARERFFTLFDALICAMSRGYAPPTPTPAPTGKTRYLRQWEQRFGFHSWDTHVAALNATKPHAFIEELKLTQPE